MQIITLSNGKRVGNFSSPHDFKFVDGSVLPAVPPTKARSLQVMFHEVNKAKGMPGDVELTFSSTVRMREEMERWRALYHNADVEVVFCPLPMLQALKVEGYDIKNSPFRAVRIENRIDKLISIDKQCVL